MNERKTIIFAVVFYVAGLRFSSIALAPGQDLFFEILAGFGITGPDFGLRLWSFGKRRKSQHRLWCGHCGSSAGQVVGAPTAELPPRMSPLQTVFMIFAKSNLFAFAALPFLRLRKTPTRIEPNQGLNRLEKSFRDPSFIIGTLGVFSCGYQPGFITKPLGPVDTKRKGPQAWA